MLNVMQEIIMKKAFKRHWYVALENKTKSIAASDLGKHVSVHIFKNTKQNILFNFYNYILLFKVYIHNFVLKSYLFSSVSVCTLVVNTLSLLKVRSS